MPKIVYSTNPDFKDDDIEQKTVPTKQNLRIWIEKRPGNKTVSIIRGFVGTNIEIQNLSKKIKKRCGVGGSVKANEIIIQTKDRQNVVKFLKELGYSAKLSGG